MKSDLAALLVLMALSAVWGGLAALTLFGRVLC